MDIYQTGNYNKSVKNNRGCQYDTRVPARWRLRALLLLPRCRVTEELRGARWLACGRVHTVRSMYTQNDSTHKMAVAEKELTASMDHLRIYPKAPLGVAIIRDNSGQLPKLVEGPSVWKRSVAKWYAVRIDERPLS